MLILDTDHMSAIERDEALGQRLVERLENTEMPIMVTIISVDEQLRGLLNLVKRARNAEELIAMYRRMQAYVEDLTDWSILSWTGEASKHFAHLQEAKPRIGTMDLRIACIALANNATLLSANLRDFRKVPTSASRTGLMSQLSDAA